MNDDFFSLEPFVEIVEELMVKNTLQLDSIEDILEEKTGVRPVFDDDVTALSIDWTGVVNS